MFLFVLIGICLVLTGIAGLQFTYLFYVDRMYRERRKYMHTLEQRSEKLTSQLETARKQLAEQQDLIEAAYPELKKRDEMWADVIDER